MIGTFLNDKESGTILRMADTSNDGLTKFSFRGGAHGFNLNKGNREIVDLSLVKRGARLKFFDEAGDKAAITLTLSDDGQPFVITSFGNKYKGLTP